MSDATKKKPRILYEKIASKDSDKGLREKAIQAMIDNIRGERCPLVVGLAIDKRERTVAQLKADESADRAVSAERLGVEHADVHTPLAPSDKLENMEEDDNARFLAQLVILGNGKAKCWGTGQELFEGGEVSLAGRSALMLLAGSMLLEQGFSSLGDELTRINTPGMPKAAAALAMLTMLPMPCDRLLEAAQSVAIQILGTDMGLTGKAEGDDQKVPVRDGKVTVN